MEDDEDDLYDAPPATNGSTAGGHATNRGNDVAMKQEEDIDIEVDDDDGDDDDDSDSDIDIITEKPKDAPATSTQDFKRAKQEPVRISQPTESTPARSQQPGTVKSEPVTAQGGKLVVRDGSKYPEFRSSKLDVDAVPLYDPAGKPITDVDLDADIAMETKPWRVPGTDPTDFFNYGFDEFTWVQYCLKQKTMKDNVQGLKNDSKAFEAMFAQPQPPMGGMSMPGMPEMDPQAMQAMMSMMQSQGMDPSQMDFDSFMQQMQSMGGMPNMGNMQGNFGQQNYGGQQGYGGGTPQGQGQGQAHEGYSAQQMAMMQQQQGGGGMGRGRGRNRRWN